MNNPLKVVIVGSGGRLGAAVVRRLRLEPEKFRVIAYDHKAMDLLRPEQIEDHLAPIQFDALINCAALTGLEACEDHPSNALQINAMAPLQMAKCCVRQQARMIQIGTDYVYDGTEPNTLRKETDTPNPLGMYSLTKLRGDEQVLAENGSFLVARTSWVFGPDRASFVDQLLHQAKDQDSVAAVEDKYSTPSYSVDLANWLALILEKPSIAGILNLCNSGTASWREFAQYALQTASKLGWPLRTTRVDGLKMEDMKQFRAQRPRFTSLDTSRLSAELKFPIRSWQDALEEYLQTFYVSSRAGL